MWLESLLLLLLLCGLLFTCLRYHYEYWKRQQVPQLRPTYGLGILGGLFSMQRSPAEFVQSLYDHPDARQQPFVGIHVFNQPGILLRDPELVKRCLVKDFSKFCDRFSNSDCKGDPLGSLNIFFLRNPAWKEVRFKLSPFFSSGKLKHMLPLVEEVGRELDKYLLTQPIVCAETKSFTLEMKELCALYTTDVIATVAYGVQANCFKNPNGEFRRHGRAVFKFSLRRSLEFMVVFFMPHLVPYLRFKVVPPTSTEFLRSAINYVMQQRELSGQKRNDLIDILIEFKNSTKETPSTNGLVFEGDLLVAQAALFFTAGFETSSATMSFALYELAKRPDLQQRVRVEIADGLRRTAGKVTQEFIDSLTYMQMIIDEVLRLYPPLPFLDRQCTAEEGYSLEPFHKFRMPQGMPVYIPVYGLHMDPEIYPEPKKFDPERFAPQNKKQLKPYTYMPFGLGPHGCIGE
ncbi:probable cytochrome P450 6g2, partial [Rhagoletis pomonella]|uniref:probable cytochrome P450 6g2 n=1 Tax=Rhagoletis pomonella TaxID=28610 RepID=UPI00177F657B